MKIPDAQNRYLIMPSNLFQISSQELTLDIGEDRILLESMKHGYLFDKFVNYRLNQDRARAIFDKTNKVSKNVPL